MVSKGAERADVRRHGEAAKVSRDDLPPPSSLLGDGPAHALAQTFLDLLELRPHAIGSGLPLDLEAALAGSAADEGETEEGKGFRLSLSKPCRARAARDWPPRSGRTR